MTSGYPGLSLLPDDLQKIVGEFVSSRELHVEDAAAMAGQCLDVSADLAEHLEAAGAEEAWASQVWDPPAEIEDNDMAHGHYVCQVVWTDGGRYYIDLTAAQFAALYDGPQATTEDWWW